jgi:hypothetical protein
MTVLLLVGRIAVQSRTRNFDQKYSHARKHATHTHTHTCTHTITYTHTHMHTQAHTHIYIYSMYHLCVTKTIHCETSYKYTKETIFTA